MKRIATLNLETSMSKVPADLKYTKTHEWLRSLPDGTMEIGITDHAQHALGDLVFVEVPEAGRALKAGEPCAVVESVKAASDVYAPVTGEVVAGNPKLASEPEVVNTDSYGEGWLMRIRPVAGAATAEFLSPAEYEKLQQEEGD
jgi:glycine cleavage system H protein